jgi:hypothetical protein
MPLLTDRGQVALALSTYTVKKRQRDSIGVFIVVPSVTIAILRISRTRRAWEGARHLAGGSMAGIVSPSSPGLSTKSRCQTRRTPVFLFLFQRFCLCSTGVACHKSLHYAPVGQESLGSAAHVAEGSMAGTPVIPLAVRPLRYEVRAKVNDRPDRELALHMKRWLERARWEESVDAAQGAALRHR